MKKNTEEMKARVAQDSEFADDYKRPRLISFGTLAEIVRGDGTGAPDSGGEFDPVDLE